MKDDSFYVAMREWQPSQEAGMTSSAEHPVSRPAPRVGRTPLADQVRLKGLQPLRSLADLQADVWESDEELNEFLAFVDASRHAHNG
jgi:hypothetical protein